MSNPGDVPNLQYYKDFNTPLNAAVIRQLLKDDYKSRRPRRCLTNFFRLVGFICLMSGISYIIVNQHLQPPPQPPIQSNSISSCPKCTCPSPATTLPTPGPSPKVPTSCPTTTTAGLTAAQVVRLMTSPSFDKIIGVKAFEGALYFPVRKYATLDNAKVKESVAILL